MGNNVTKTPIEKLKSDGDDGNDDYEDNKIPNNFNANKINGLTDDDLHIDNQFSQQLPNDPNWSHFGAPLDIPNDNSMEETSLSINERVREMREIGSISQRDEEPNDIPIESIETNDPEMITESVVDWKTKPTVVNTLDKTQSLPPFKRNLEVVSDINEIEDLESIHSGSKLTLNDLNDSKSDTEDVIQELTKLNLDLEDGSDRYSSNYRKRGQSWSNWENNNHVDLKAESSLSSFSRPASIDHKPIKTKSYTAPEMRGQSDSAIEWLAKQGLEIGIGLEYESKQKPNETHINSRNTLRLTSVEIPGSVSSATHSTPAVMTRTDGHLRYDALDQQIIDDIENEYIR